LGRCRRQLLPPVQPAGRGEVGGQVQCVRRAGGGTADLDVEELPVPPGAGDLQPGDRRRWRVEGLQRADRGGGEPGDDVTYRALAQECGERLHLGQLRHAVQYAPTRGQAPVSPQEPQEPRNPGNGGRQLPPTAASPREPQPPGTPGNGGTGSSHRRRPAPSTPSPEEPQGTAAPAAPTHGGKPP